MAVAVVMNQVAAGRLLRAQSFPHVCRENPQLKKTGRVELGSSPGSSGLT